MDKQTTSDIFQKIFIEKNTNATQKESVLVKANEKYNKLVSTGVIKKRGYTLRGIEDSHLFHIRFNGY